VVRACSVDLDWEECGESFFRGGTCHTEDAARFRRVRRTSVEGVDDVVASGARIEKSNAQRLPVKGISMQMKWISELALDAPKALGVAVRHFPLFQGMLAVEGAAGSKV